MNEESHGPNSGKEVDIVLTDDEMERFISKIGKSETNDECWKWNSNIHKQGYGLIKFRDKTVKAHRLSYAVTVFGKLRFAQ